MIKQLIPEIRINFERFMSSIIKNNPLLVLVTNHEQVRLEEAMNA